MPRRVAQPAFGRNSNSVASPGITSPRKMSCLPITYAQEFADSVTDFRSMIAQARASNPAVYIRNIATYDGTAGPLTKAPGSGTFQSRPAVWVIQNGKPALLSLR